MLPSMVWMSIVALALGYAWHREGRVALLWAVAWTVVGLAAALLVAIATGDH